MTATLLQMILFAEEKHRGQKRDHGVPYIVHPIQVATKVAEFTNDHTALISAIGHDLLEDTNATEQEVQYKFGPETLLLIKQLTNDYPDSLEYAEKMLAVAKHAKEITDSRAQLIKLCDRLCNLHDCEAWKPKRIAKYIINTNTILQNLPVSFENRQSYWYNQLLAEINEQLETIVKIDGVHGFLTALSEESNEKTV